MHLIFDMAVTHNLFDRLILKATMPQSNSMANDAITISDSEPESDPPRANLDRSNNLKHAPQRFGYGSRVQNFTESVSSPLYPTPSRFVSPSSAHAFSSHCLPPIQQSYPPIGHIPHPQGEYSNLINQSLSYQSPAQNDWGYIRYPSNQPHIQNRRVSVAQNRSSLTASYPNINAGTNFGSRLSPLDEQRARTEHQIPEIQQIPEEQQVSKKQRSQEVTQTFKGHQGSKISPVTKEHTKDISKPPYCLQEKCESENW